LAVEDAAGDVCEDPVAAFDRVVESDESGGGVEAVGIDAEDPFAAETGVGVFAGRASG
jgi:hypothetical protein